jgi:hypothetical protein
VPVRWKADASERLHLALNAGNAAHVDDGAPPSGHHAKQHGLDQVDRRKEVDIKLALPFARWRVNAWFMVAVSVTSSGKVRIQQPG